MREISAKHPAFIPLKKPPKTLYALGDERLLETKMISIVGTRRPMRYTKEATQQLSYAFSQIGYTVVSGAAMGVDAIAHLGALPNTIAVMANSLDICYPKINQTLITQIYQEGLAISEYSENTKATKYSFVIRNRLVVALGEVLVITEADENSGTMRSAEIAKALGKEIYVLPHRLGESRGTQKLLEEGSAKLITDIDHFVSQFGTPVTKEDDFSTFFKQIPSLDEALAKFGDTLYEYELEGRVEIKNLKVYLC
ncbi:MAG: DNA-protecting protein DprA [Epsilonproteobacteria bacterium]|nr:DNA-protecting protein DprA [Campylobacterota bacterium]